MRRREFMLAAGAGIASLSGARAADGAKPFMSLGYNPSRVVSMTELMRGIAPNHIKADLERIAPLTRGVRTYNVDLGLDAVLPAAKELGLRVSLGLYLGPDRGKNDTQIARGLNAMAAHGEVIDRVYVGNETLQRKELAPAELAAYVRRVRAGVAASGIKVGTGEAWHDWLKAPDVAAACDFIGAHLYPYWDGVGASEGVDYVARRLGEMRRAFPGKPVVIAETGWPSAGPVREGAVPSLENQRRFMADFLTRARAEHYDYCYFEAYDQPWKGHGIEGAVGAHWGLFDGLRPKVALTGL
jgi:exo-beta-1,3-glucanase (GH17 family)